MNAKRIPFGQEKRMIQLSPTCGDCDAFLGELHTPGCQLEECPHCGLSLIYCRCTRALPVNEEFALAVELAAKFESRLHSDQNIASEQDKGRVNLVESAAALRGMIERPNTIVNGVTPIGWSTPGEPVFSDETLKNALNLTNEGVDYIRSRMFERQPSPSNCWC